MYVCFAHFNLLHLLGGKVGQAGGHRDYQGHDLGTSRQHEKEDGMVMEVLDVTSNRGPGDGWVGDAGVAMA